MVIASALTFEQFLATYEMNEQEARSLVWQLTPTEMYALVREYGPADLLATTQLFIAEETVDPRARLDLEEGIMGIFLSHTTFAIRPLTLACAGFDCDDS